MLFWKPVMSSAVDVVNRKWLVHTPTAYIDWIEEAPWDNVDGYYSGGSISGNDFKRLDLSTQKDTKLWVEHGTING